jgi:hypothetical protein
MLTEEQKQFLYDHRPIFEKLIPFKTEELKLDDRRLLIKKGKQIRDNTEEIEVEKKKIQIKEILDKMTMNDIDQFNKLLNNIKDTS